MSVQSESFKRLAVGVAAAKQGQGPAVSMAPFGMDDVENVLGEVLVLQADNELLREALKRVDDMHCATYQRESTLMRYIARRALADKLSVEAPE